MPQQNQVVTQAPWSSQAPYLEDLFKKTSELFTAQGVPENYPGSRVARFTPNQQWGQNYLSSYAQGVAPQIATQVQGTHGRLLNASDVNNNPHLQGAIRVAQQPTQDRLMEEILPNVGSQAQAQGAYGGARHGLLESGIVRDAGRLMGEMATRMSSDAYGQGLQAELGALSMTPTVLEAGTAPGRITSSVGDVQQNQNQALINDAVEKWFYNHNAPWDALNRYAGTIQGQYGSTTTTPISRTNPTLGAIGGAAAGVGLASELEANNNITALLALLGALGGGKG